MKNRLFSFILNRKRMILACSLGLLVAGCMGDDLTPADTSPDPFVIPPVLDAGPSVWVNFGPYKITGINTGVDVLLNKGEVKIGDDGEYTSKPTTIFNQQPLYYRIKSSATSAGTTKSWLWVGDFRLDISVLTNDFDFDHDGRHDELDQDIDGDGVNNFDDPAPRNPKVKYLLRWAHPAPPMHTHLFTDTDINALKVADINHDGLVDIVGLHKKQLVWRKGMGNGVFSPQTAISGFFLDQTLSEHYQIVDIDKDNKLEIIQFSERYPLIHKFMENGKVQTRRRSLPSIYRLVELDNEHYYLGKNTLTPVNETAPPVSITPCDTSVLESPHVNKVATGDFKGLGQDQIIISFNDNKNYFYKKENDNYHCETIYVNYPSTVSGFTTTDINSDGKDEIIVSFGNREIAPSAILSKMEYQSDGYFRLHPLSNQTFLSFNKAKISQPAMGDIDGDGDTDIIQSIGYDNVQKIAIYTNQIDSVFSREELNPSAHPETQHVVIADVNRDNINDIVSEFAWYEGRPYRDLWLTPDKPTSVSFTAIGDKNSILSYSVTSDYQEWFSIDPDGGDLNISYPGLEGSDRAYVDARVTATDGTYQLHRIIRVHLLDHTEDFDQDGVDNINDAFPFDSSEWKDLDKDGIGDNSDTDRDDDGIHKYYDIDDFDVESTQFPKWKNQANGLKAIPLTLNNKGLDIYSWKKITADVGNDGKDEIIAVDYKRLFVTVLSLNAEGKIEEKNIYKVKTGCNIASLAPHPKKEFAVFSIQCSGGITSFNKLNFADLSIDKLANHVGPSLNDLYMKLLQSDSYTLTRYSPEKMFYYDEKQNQWRGSIGSLDKSYFPKYGPPSPFMDANGDGLDDFVDPSEAASIMLNQGNGQFADLEDGVLPFPAGAKNHHFSRDSNNDLIHKYTLNGAEFVSLHRLNDSITTNVCDSKFVPHSPTPIDCDNSLLVDINQDGLFDLVSYSMIWENNGNYHYSPHSSVPHRAQLKGYSLSGDFNGDGVTDFVAKAGRAGSSILLWRDPSPKTAVAGETLTWLETLDSSAQSLEIQYKLEQGLDSQYFIVNRYTGEVQFMVPGDSDEMKTQYQCWLIAETTLGYTRKLLQVKVKK